MKTIILTLLSSILMILGFIYGIVYFIKQHKGTAHENKYKYIFLLSFLALIIPIVLLVYF